MSKPGLTYPRSTESGFTLAEVAIAIAILGLALSTLLGLNTRLLDTYYSELHRARASFYAQYLLARIEVSAETPAEETNERPLYEALEEAGYFEKFPVKTTKDDFRTWKLSLAKTPVSLALIEDGLVRLDLAISWGDSGDDEFRLTYFIENEETSATAPNSPTSPAPKTPGRP